MDVSATAIEVCFSCLSEATMKKERTQEGLNKHSSFAILQKILQKIAISGNKHD